jgi:hypothetical protein
LSFTVFNQTIEAVVGTPSKFESGNLSAGGNTTFAFNADGTRDLQIVLGWPALAGSTFALTVVAPDGTVFSQTQQPLPPIIVIARKAAAGTWTVDVRDVTSSPSEPWWVIVGRS